MFSVACILLACFTFVDSSAANRCPVQVSINFIEDETTDITCSGLPVKYWSITGPSTGGQETRIGDCSKCLSVGACSCDTDSADYTITRIGETSTLFFVNNLPNNNRSTIMCSGEDNATCIASEITILKAPARCQHANNCIEIVADQPAPVTCKGAPDKDIHWSVTRAATGDTEIRIGNCSKCGTVNNRPCECHTHNGDYSITRTGDRLTAVSILHFVNNVATNDNSTIKCSTSDDTVLVSLRVDVISDYTLPQCRNGQLNISEAGRRLPINCEGVGSGHSVNWTLTDDNGHVTDLAVCTGHDCTTNDDVTASKTDKASTLTFVDITGLEDNQTLTCVRKTGSIKASCRIWTYKNDITTEERSTMSVVVVAGGVGAAVVVIIVVIVAVVVFRRRTGKRNGLPATDPHRQNKAVHEHPSGDYYLTPVASHATRHEDQLPYDSLQMSEVGLRSEYSDVGRHGNVSHADPGEDQLPYDGLQMSEVGLRSVYSVVGSRGNASHAISGATPYGNLRRSDVGLTSEYCEIGATRTSP